MRGGECPVIPPVHWKEEALPQQRSSRKLKTLYNVKGLYSLFSAVERFLSYVRGISLFKFFRDILYKRLRDLCTV